MFPGDWHLSLDMFSRCYKCLLYELDLMQSCELVELVYVKSIAPVSGVRPAIG